MTETGDRTAHPEVSGTGGAGDTDDLCSRTATELLQDYRSGSLSPVEVTDAVLARIERLDPLVNAFCLVDAEEARAQARASEEGTVDRLHCRLARLRVPHLLLRRDGTLNVVVADRPGHLDRLTALLDFAPSIGVSDRIRAADRLPEAAQQAYWALGAAEAENRRLVRYGDETALLLPRTPLEAQALVSRVLGPLLAHDAEHGTAYLRTLRVMLHRDRSWQLAADELHIHKQTLGYRLRRIEQLTGRGLTRTEHIAELWFAVRAHDMVQRRLPAAGAPAA